MFWFYVAFQVVVIVQIHLLASLISWTTLRVLLGCLLDWVGTQATWTSILNGVIFAPSIKASLLIILLTFSTNLVYVWSWSQVLNLIINCIKTQPIIALITHTHNTSTSILPQNYLLICSINTKPSSTIHSLVNTPNRYISLTLNLLLLRLLIWTWWHVLLSPIYSILLVIHYLYIVNVFIKLLLN
jgi:hypothetical protein